MAKAPFSVRKMRTAAIIIHHEEREPVAVSMERAATRVAWDCIIVVVGPKAQKVNGDKTTGVDFKNLGPCRFGIKPRAVYDPNWKMYRSKSGVWWGASGVPASPRVAAGGSLAQPGCGAVDILKVQQTPDATLSLLRLLRTAGITGAAKTDASALRKPAVEKPNPLRSARTALSAAMKLARGCDPSRACHRCRSVTGGSTNVC